MAIRMQLKAISLRRRVGWRLHADGFIVDTLSNLSA